MARVFALAPRAGAPVELALPLEAALVAELLLGDCTHVIVAGASKPLLAFLYEEASVDLWEHLAEKLGFGALRAPAPVFCDLFWLFYASRAAPRDVTPLSALDPESLRARAPVAYPGETDQACLLFYFATGITVPPFHAAPREEAEAAARLLAPALASKLLFAPDGGAGPAGGPLPAPPYHILAARVEPEACLLLAYAQGGAAALKALRERYAALDAVFAAVPLDAGPAALAALYPLLASYAPLLRSPAPRPRPPPLRELGENAVARLARYTNAELAAAYDLSPAPVAREALLRDLAREASAPPGWRWSRGCGAESIAYGTLGALTCYPLASLARSFARGADGAFVFANPHGGVFPRAEITELRAALGSPPRGAESAASLVLALVEEGLAVPQIRGVPAPVPAEGLAAPAPAPAEGLAAPAEELATPAPRPGGAPAALTAAPRVRLRLSSVAPGEAPGVDPDEAAASTARMLSKGPMLAVDGTDDLEALQYPLLASFKIDGMRVALVTKDGIVRAKTRSLEDVPNPHARRRLMTLPAGLDGEVGVVDASGEVNFRATMSAMRTVNNAKDAPFVYYVFDYFLAADLPFTARLALLRSLPLPAWVTVLEQRRVHGPQEVREMFAAARAQKYEGLMLRKEDAPYKFGRATLSKQELVKVKAWLDAEAVVVGVTQLRSNSNPQVRSNTGHAKRSTRGEGMVEQELLGALVVQSPSWAKPFEIGTGFTREDRESMWADPPIGETVRFAYAPTGGYGVPRHAVFQGFRPAFDISARPVSGAT